MSDADTKRDRIKAKVAASQERLTRDSEFLPAVPQRKNLPDAYPPEDYRSLAAEYPLLTVAAGLGLGMLQAVMGALFLGIVKNALPVIGISPFWQMAISGSAILIAIAFNARGQGPAGRIILTKAEHRA